MTFTCETGGDQPSEIKWYKKLGETNTVITTGQFFVVLFAFPVVLLVSFLVVVVLLVAILVFLVHDGSTYS